MNTGANTFQGHEHRSRKAGTWIESVPTGLPDRAPNPLYPPTTELHVEGASTRRIDTLSDDVDHDRIELARIGKRQVLKRNFGLTSMTGFNCGLMCTWEGLLTGFVLGFDNGGPAGLIYGLIYTWAGTMSVFVVLGELSAMAPTAGGQYHWVSLLAPPSSKKFLSYMAGWLTVTGWVAALAATSFFVASLITALVQLNSPSHTFQPWQETLTFWAILLISVTINTAASRILPMIENMILVVHILGFFAIIIPVIYLSPHKSAYEVFTTFRNTGGWSTQALSFFIGLQGNANAFVGADGAIHMSEEVKHASKNVPKSMVYSILINGALAFGMLLAVLFCTNPDDVPSDAQYPFVFILSNAVQSNTGASVMAAIILFMQFCASVGCLAASSRMIWAFSRDRGMPGWRLLSQVGTHTTIPLYGIGLATCVAAVIGFINLGSTTAFNDVISLTLEGLFTSYFIACVLLLYRRIRGEVGERDELSDDEQTGDGPSKSPLAWGAWRIPGIVGTLNNAFACVYLFIISFFSFWPTETPVAAKDMNYSVLVWGAVIAFSLVYYVARARRYYIGPVVEVTLVRA